MLLQRVFVQRMSECHPRHISFGAAVRTGVNFPGVFKFDMSRNDISRRTFSSPVSGGDGSFVTLGVLLSLLMMFVPSSIVTTCVALPIDRFAVALARKDFPFLVWTVSLYTDDTSIRTCARLHPHLETITKPFGLGSMASSTVSGEPECSFFVKRPFVSTDSVLACNSCSCC